ncbi:MAG: hypothetical protein HY302_02705 [Opitutae bacterium]|nr:hypothetical protein [Opitutae bacterium]
MTQTEALQAHRRLCDELHQLALEENRFLKEHRQLPPPALLERKRGLITRLDASLAALREAPPARPGDPDRRALIEKAREKILQILHLDRENEQLMLRYTLSRPGHAPRASAMAPAAPAADAPLSASAAAPTIPPASPEAASPPAPVGSLSQLQRLYDRLR